MPHRTSSGPPALNPPLVQAKALHRPHSAETAGGQGKRLEIALGILEIALGILDIAPGILGSENQAPMDCH